MRAAQFSEYGPPNVLRVADVPEPQAGPGQVLVRVAVAAVNPFDLKVRSGMFAGDAPPPAPITPGGEAAGTVVAVGAGVADLAVGEEVLGRGDGVTAELAVLDQVWRRPPDMPVEVAAALPIASETAGRVLSLLPLDAGDLVVVEGASGSVGTALVQLAVRRGLRVVGTASERHHDALRALGVVPTTYGPGLPARVAAVADGPVAAGLDLAGAPTSVRELVELAGDPARVVTIADFDAADVGVRVSGGPGEARVWEAVDEAVEQWSAGALEVPVALSVPLEQVVRAHEALEQGRLRGKVLVTLP